MNEGNGREWLQTHMAISFHLANPVLLPAVEDRTSGTTYEAADIPTGGGCISDQALLDWLAANTN